MGREAGCKSMMCDGQEFKKPSGIQPGTRYAATTPSPPNMLSVNLVLKYMSVSQKIKLI